MGCHVTINSAASFHRLLFGTNWAKEATELVVWNMGSKYFLAEVVGMQMSWHQLAFWVLRARTNSDICLPTPAWISSSCKSHSSMFQLQAHWTRCFAASILAPNQSFYRNKRRSESCLAWCTKMHCTLNSPFRIRIAPYRCLSRLGFFSRSFCKAWLVDSWLLVCFRFRYISQIALL